MAPKRENFIPVIYLKGTHYEVGFSVGSTFRSMIQEYIASSTNLHENLVPYYESVEGKKYFDDNLAIIEKIFPNYVEELHGIADGSKVSFHKLLLMHLDIAYSSDLKKSNLNFKEGCSTIMCNHLGQAIIGHTEDALPNALNHCYIVNAEIIKKRDDGQSSSVEKFGALCYAGELPGFCMGHNANGIVFSVNLILPKKNPSLFGTIPRHFLCRALLSAHNIDEAKTILSAVNYGLNDGFSINIGYLDSEENISFCNIELGPGSSNDKSNMDVLQINRGESYLHCNNYKRLNIPYRDANCLTSSLHREAVYNNFPSPTDDSQVCLILGDQSDSEYPFFREGTKLDHAITIATGIFNLVERTWSIYVENPSKRDNLLCKFPLFFDKIE